MYDARQLFPVEDMKHNITDEFEGALMYGKYIDGTKFAMKEKPQHIDSGDEEYGMGIT